MTKLTGDGAGLTPPPRRRVAKSLGWVALGLIIGAGGMWAGLELTASPVQDLDGQAAVTVPVTVGEISDSMSLNTAAWWDSEPAGRNRATGVITAVHHGEGEAAAGTLLYSVDQRPVVIGQGAVPSYRSLAQHSSGQDVAQLQDMLKSLGLFEHAADGKFGPSTVRAVKAWQKSLGLAQTGVVETRDIIFVPRLPTSIMLDGELVAVGQDLSGGETTVLQLAAAPSFEVPLSSTQLVLVDIGTQVTIAQQDGPAWVGVVTEHVPDPQNHGQFQAILASPTDQPICLDQCAGIPTLGRHLLRSEVVTVPAVSGSLIPTAALFTNASGQSAVKLEDGTEVVVSVSGAARGSVIVTGVNEGQRVQLIGASGNTGTGQGTEQPSPPPGPTEPTEDSTP